MPDVAALLAQLTGRPEPAADPALAVVKLARARLDALVLKLGQTIEAKVAAQLPGGFTQLSAGNDTFVLKLATPLPANAAVKLTVTPTSSGQPQVTVTPLPAPTASPLPAPAPKPPLPALLLPPLSPSSSSGPVASLPPIPQVAPTGVPPTAESLAPPVFRVPATIPAASTPTLAPATTLNQGGAQPPALQSAQQNVQPATPAPVSTSAPAVSSVPTPPPTITSAPQTAATATPPAPTPGPMPQLAPTTPFATQLPSALPPTTLPPLTPMTAPLAQTAAVPAPTGQPPVPPASAATPAPAAISVATPTPASVVQAISVSLPPVQPSPPQPAGARTPFPAQPAPSRLPQPSTAPARPPTPPTPAPPLAQILADPVQAAARQDSIVPLLAKAAAALASPGAVAALPRPVLEAIARVLTGRLDLNRTPLDGRVLREAMLKTGVAREPATQPHADARSGVLSLRAALTAFLGSEVEAIAPVAPRPPPPLKGHPARAPEPRLPFTAPAEEPVETARQLLGHTDAALSRLKLLQHASAPDARPGITMAAPELRVEVPLMLGAETGILQLLVERDGKRKSSPRERGWRIRFALNFSMTGEVGAEIALLGRSANVSLWAAEPQTADALEAILPELTPALARHGLDVTALRVRSGVPGRHSQAPGQLLDSAR